jgi:hypothetical protein
MRLLKIIVTSSLLIGIVLLGLGNVAAQEYLSQGTLQGFVLGSSSYHAAEPFDWALVMLRGNGNTFEAFSGMSGFYQIFLPAGTYNVTVSVPVDSSYMAYRTAVNITPQSRTVLDFYLVQVWPVNG